MLSFRGPNNNTVADGYSRTDERRVVNEGDVDFAYDGTAPYDDQTRSRRTMGTTSNNTAMPSDDEMMDSNHNRSFKLEPSHPGEYHDDTGEIPLGITSATYLYVFAAAVNSCNLGYDIGVSTQVGIMIQKQFDLGDVQREFFIGSLNMFAMTGCLCAHWICDRYGRRKSFIMAAVTFIIGVTIMALADNFGVLMVGRAFVGLGVGFGLAVDPIYISEVSPAKYRGELVTWSEIATNVGIVLGFTSGFVFLPLADWHSQWRLMIAAGAILPIFMIFAALFIMQESPRWLVATGNDFQAKRVLKQIYPIGYDVEAIIAGMKEALQREQIAERVLGWDVILFPTPAFRRMLIVGIGTAIAQQAVGIDAIQYFLLDLLQMTSIRTEAGRLGVLIALGVVKLIFIIIGGKLFDRTGRRPLFMVSLFGMAAALFLVSVAFFGTARPNTVFVVVGLGIYLAFFSLGMGPGAWLVPSEIFPTCIRAKAMSLATFANRATATAMSTSFLSTGKAMTWAAYFFLISVVCLLIALFIYFLLPETKGRSLEDMSVYFAEITGDESILEAEAKILRERAATQGLEMFGTTTTAQRELHHQQQQDGSDTGSVRMFQPPRARDMPPEYLPDAKVQGTLT